MEEDGKTEESKKADKMAKSLRYVQILQYTTFLAPIFISFLFMHELTGSFVTETLGVDNLIWQLVRMFVVLLAMGARFYLFRDEL